MKLRVARHTKNIKSLTEFYTLIPGMTILGSFTGHDGYDGIFIGLPAENWHLEFTESRNAPDHAPGEDDLLVFYAETAEAYSSTLRIFEQMNIPEKVPVNPYWTVHGKTYEDPDGFRIVIAMPTG